MRVSRLAVVAALVGAFCLAASASASADTTSCKAEGSVKLSPGLTETATVQNVQVKGTLSMCSGEESAEVTGGSFQIHEKTAAVTCAALKTGISGEEGSIKLKWKPKPAAGSQSSATGELSLIEGAGALSGTITSGPFNEDVLGGTLTQAYKGASECGGAPAKPGKGKGKKIKDGTLSGTVSISEPAPPS